VTHFQPQSRFLKFL